MPQPRSTKKRTKPIESPPPSIVTQKHNPTAIQKATQSPTRASVWTIWYAAQYGKYERVQSILDRHAVVSIDVQEYNTKWSALHFACRYGHVQVVQLLLDRGAQPNLRDHLGHTALHLSSGWGTLRCTMLLLSAGANLLLTNDNGQTPLDIARRMNRVDQCRTLELWQPIGLTEQELRDRQDITLATDPVVVKVAKLKRLESEIDAEKDPVVRQELHALHAKTQSYGDLHPTLLITLDRLATLYRNTNRLEQALTMTDRALTMAEELYGQHHETTLVWLNNTAELLQLLDRLEECEHYMQQAYAGMAELLGDTHSSTLSALENLAIVGYTCQQWSETEQYLRKLLEGLNTIYDGASNDRVLNLRIRLATVMMKQKRAQEARPMLEECIQEAISLFSSEHAQVVTCCDQLGRCLFVLGEFQMAEDHFRRALKITMSPTASSELQSQQQRLHNNIAMITIARRSHNVVQTRLKSDYNL